ncbi:hypothetical protein ARMSODRAFT_964692 [Armillaria solidipes]|uniref:Uncharacterized protein n=1 Tax=Armillaria solidipes TaxID=1076256 RepID=A0A2H3ASI0_9AGAR|nr:hypothetical protein ARMSODRAFT_964692 [Armillaria solidipes]
MGTIRDIQRRRQLDWSNLVTGPGTNQSDGIFTGTHTHHRCYDPARQPRMAPLTIRRVMHDVAAKM